MHAEGSRWTAAVPVAATALAYAALFGFALADDTSPLVAVLIAPLLYGAAVYLYFGLTRLAFTRWMIGLITLAAAAVMVGAWVTGGTNLWILVTGWTMIAVTASLAGRMTSGGWRPRTVYVAAVVSLVVLGTAQYLPTWLEMIAAAPAHVQSLVAEAQRQLSAIGESEQRSRQILQSFEVFTTVLFRLIPAVMLLSAVVQFSLGYLLFARWITRHRVAPERYDPFHYWKMPFGCVPLVAAAAALRLLGPESVRIAADNALAFLAVFYTLTGLALIEYVLRKIQFTRFMKVLLYLFLALLPLAFPLVGLFVTGLIVLLGFFDSFADWRRVRLREFV